MLPLFETLLTLTAYLLLGGLLYRRLIAATTAVTLPPELPRQRLQLGLTLTLLLHGATLWQQILTDQGVVLSFFIALSLVAWVINLLVLGSMVLHRLDTLGVITFPVAAIAVILAATITVNGSTFAGLSGGLKLHISLSILSYSVLSLAALQALLLAFQESLLRRRQLRRAMALFPPLERMEIGLFRLIGSGYLLLTLSLLTGVTYLHDIMAQHLLHKTVLSVSAWVIFALLLWGRLSRGWRGRVAIRWTLSGFALLLLAYFGSKLVLELILTHRI